jgi:RNA polymerase sigma factor (sigma-70 family)
VDGDEIADLLARASSGDQTAWDRVVARYAGLLWAVARGFRLDAADAADAVQNTWLRLVENLDRITEPDKLGSWLGTTVRRECLQVLRRAGRETTGPGPELLGAVPDPAPPVDERLLLRERDAALWRTLSTLSDQCRRLLRVLMASPPPSYADVAVALDIAIGTIGPARQRCLDRLRRAAAAEELLAGPGADRGGSL